MRNIWTEHNFKQDELLKYFPTTKPVHFLYTHSHSHHKGTEDSELPANVDDLHLFIFNS